MAILPSFQANDKEALEILFKTITNLLKTKHQLSTAELIKKIGDEPFIPSSIFNQQLSSFETICKYLKENLSLSNKKIASVLNKSQKSIWQAYNSAKKKEASTFVVKDSNYNIPCSIFNQPGLSVFEIITQYLKDGYGLTYHEIAVILQRDDRTIWTIYQRARKKNVKAE